MKASQSYKRSLFSNRASSDPKEESGKANIQTKNDMKEFRNRAKTLEPPQIQKITKTLTRQRSKTVTLAKPLDMIKSTGSMIDDSNHLRNVHSNESFLIHNCIPKFNFVILGSSGCGKTNLINSLLNIDYRHSFQIDFVENVEQNTIHILMNGDEFELSFFEVDTNKNDLWRSVSGAGYIILFNIDNELSIYNAIDVMCKLREQNRTTNLEMIILVGNNPREIRRSCTLEKAKNAARQNLCKFIEISLENERNIDILLAMIIKNVTQYGIYNDNGSLRKAAQNQYSPKVGCSNFSCASKNLMNKVLTKKQKPSKSVEDLFSTIKL